VSIGFLDRTGIKVSAVEVKHVDLPDNMQRSMPRQAEAEREKRAKIIHAAGELEASDKLPLPIELLELLKAKLDTNPQAKSER
jgi:regulator of protease activity HflC (stomatin/prohibitin superfamily)